MMNNQAFDINKQIRNHNIDGIPNPNKKFMTLNSGNVKCLDSFQFMPSRLDQAVVIYMLRCSSQKVTIMTLTI